MSKSKDYDVSTAVLQYLMEQNRPNSCNDIISNLQKDFGKASVLKGLETLVSKGKIKEKSYGKQKIYFVNQHLFPESTDSDIQNLNADISKLSSVLKELNQHIQSKENTLRNLSSSMTNETAKIELDSTKMSIPAFKDKLKALESKSAQVDPKQKENLNTSKEKFLREYRVRKRIANSVIDAILEGYPKSKRQLIEEIGMDVDGDSTIIT